MRAEPAREGPRGLSLADTRTFACSRGFADCGQPEAPVRAVPSGLGRVLVTTSVRRVSVIAAWAPGGGHQLSLSSFPPRSPLPPASVSKLGKKILLFRRKPRTECLAVDICILMCLILLLPFTYLSLKFSRHLNSLEKSIYFPWISAVVTAAFFFFFFF